MPANTSFVSSRIGSNVLFGFIAGFLATLTFHQFGVAVLHAEHLTPFAPYAMNPVPPFGVPEVISLAFWGGVWGIALASVAPPAWRHGGGYWLGAIVFGAILPTAVAWFVVMPLKGLPAAGGFHYPGLLVGPIVNALWGFGTALFLRFMPRAAVPAS